MSCNFFLINWICFNWSKEIASMPAINEDFFVVLKPIMKDVCCMLFFGGEDVVGRERWLHHNHHQPSWRSYIRWERTTMTMMLKTFYWITQHLQLFFFFSSMTTWLAACGPAIVWFATCVWGWWVVCVASPFNGLPFSGDVVFVPFCCERSGDT